MAQKSLTREQILEAAAARGKFNNAYDAAASLGIGRSSYQHRIKEGIRLGLIHAEAVAKPKEATAFKLGASPEHRKIVGLEDEVRRLKRELELVHRDTLDEDKVRSILGVMSKKPTDAPTWLAAAKVTRNAPEVPVTIWSDWHSGEVVSCAETNGVNEFNVKVLRERVRKLVERTLRLADKHNGKYPGIVLNLLGDFVSGGLHPELQKTDEVEAIGAVLTARDLLVWGIKAIADHFGQVYLPCAAGNHGRATHKPEFKRYVFKNFDWLIYQLLEREFADDKRVRFDIRPANEVFYKVWNKRFLAMHGDMLGVKGGDGIIGAIGPISRGEVKVRGSSASTVSDYDVLLMGHWHQSLWLPRVIVANSLKGYDEFAKNALRAPVSAPSQPLFFVHPRYGITSRWEIYLEGRDGGKGTDWVSVFDKAAA